MFLDVLKYRRRKVGPQCILVFLVNYKKLKKRKGKKIKKKKNEVEAKKEEEIQKKEKGWKE